MGIISRGSTLRVNTPDGVREIPRIGRNGLPECPWEIQEEVEMFARRNNRTGKVHFAPGIGWFVRFSLRSNDPLMRAFREGTAPEPPTEDVFFRVPDPLGTRPGDSIPLDIMQLGVSGVREFLEKGDTWSGRGEHASIEDAVKKASEHNRQVGPRAKEKAREENRDFVRDKRRSLLKIPFLRVGIDLNDQK